MVEANDIFSELYVITIKREIQVLQQQNTKHDIHRHIQLVNEEIKRINMDRPCLMCTSGGKGNE